MTRSAYREAAACYEQTLETLQHLPEGREAQAIDLRLNLRNVLLPLGEQERILDHFRVAATLAEAVQEGFNGLLFPPGDADALADRLLEYFENGLGPIFSRNLESVRSPDLQVCDAIESLGRGDYGRAKPPSSGTSTSDA